MTSPFQPAAPRSDDGYWWWNGATWLPVPLEVVAAAQEAAAPAYQERVQPAYQEPGQPQYAEPQYQQPVYPQPTFGEPSQPGAVTLQAVGPQAIAPHTSLPPTTFLPGAALPGSAPREDDGSPRRVVFVAAGVTALALVVAIVVAVATGGSDTPTSTSSSSNPSTSPGVRRTLDVSAASTARNAGIAEETSFTDSGTYSTDIGVLHASGLVEEAGVTVRIAFADDAGFCLEATRGTNVATYYSLAGGLQPSGTRCATLPSSAPSPSAA